jgi:GntR family transcriptional repressor for pyruvate dehydrogenase complex
MMRNINAANRLDVAREYIKRLIQERNLKSGDFLPTEKELSESLRLSRTVVREALKGLQELGVIGSIQGKGHYLREFNFDAAMANFDYSIKPSLASFKDLLEVRIYLESDFLTRDVFLFTEEDFARLGSIIARMESQIQHGASEDDLVDAHTEFHRELYCHSCNTFLIELISLFSGLQHRFISIYNYQTADRGEFILDHRRIVDALRSRQPEIVRSVLVRHFSDPLSWVQKSMKAQHAESAAAREP